MYSMLMLKRSNKDNFIVQQASVDIGMDVRLFGLSLQILQLAFRAIITHP